MTISSNGSNITPSQEALHQIRLFSGLTHQELKFVGKRKRGLV